MTTQTAVPEGYTTHRGNLPPFVMLDSVGQAIHGTILKVRTVEKSEIRKVREGGKMREITEVKVKHYVDLSLIDGGDYNTGTLKAPDMRSFKAGEIVTLSLSADLFDGIRRAAFEAQGLGANFWPEEGEPMPEAEWPKIYGRAFFARREKDGTVKKGPYAGNKRNVYTVAIGPAVN